MASTVCHCHRTFGESDPFTDNMSTVNDVTQLSSRCECLQEEATRSWGQFVAWKNVNPHTHTHTNTYLKCRNAWELANIHYLLPLAKKDTMQSSSAQFSFGTNFNSIDICKQYSSLLHPGPFSVSALQTLVFWLKDDFMVFFQFYFTFLLARSPGTDCVVKQHHESYSRWTWLPSHLSILSLVMKYIDINPYCHWFTNGTYKHMVYSNVSKYTNRFSSTDQGNWI